MDILRSVCIVAPIAILVLALLVMAKGGKMDAFFAWVFGMVMSLFSFAAYKVALSLGAQIAVWSPFVVWGAKISVWSLSVLWGVVALCCFVVSIIDSVKAIEEGVGG